ncbi:MAG: hypothetical protein ABFD83_04670 [Armatimonadota bacterium]
MKVRRSRLLIILGSLAYVLLLQWIYPNVIAPIYSDVGMIYTRLHTWEYILQTVLGIIPAFWMPAEMKKPSQYQWWLLYLTVIVPTCILPYHVTLLPHDMITFYVFLIIVCFAFMCRISYLPPLKLPLLRISRFYFVLAVVGFTAATYGILIAYLGVRTMIPGFAEVSGLRQEFKSIGLPGAVIYLYWWQGTVVNPLITTLGLVNRKILLVILGTLLQFELFALTSLRGFGVSAMLLLGMGVLILRTRRQMGVAFLYALFGATAVMVIWHAISPSAFGPLLFLKRWILNAGQLSGYYLEFFTNHVPAHLQHSSSLLEWLFPGPYDLPKGQVIGRAYFLRFPTGDYTNATAHIWADSYASFGYFGVVWASAVAAFIMWIVDSAFRHTDRRIALMLMCVVALAYAGQGVHTSLLTGGIVPMVCVGLTSPFGSLQKLKFNDLPDENGEKWEL